MNYEEYEVCNPEPRVLPNAKYIPKHSMVIKNKRRNARGRKKK